MCITGCTLVAKDDATDTTEKKQETDEEKIITISKTGYSRYDQLIEEMSKIYHGDEELRSETLMANDMYIWGSY